MTIRDVNVPPAILEKIAWKHNVSESEVMDIFEGKPFYKFREKGNVKGEDVYVVYGRTEAGKYLLVFFIWKLNKDALVISAREMTTKERRYYEKAKTKN